MITSSIYDLVLGILFSCTYVAIAIECYKKKNLSNDHLEFIVFWHRIKCPNTNVSLLLHDVLIKLEIRVARAKMKIKAVNSKITVWHAKNSHKIDHLTNASFRSVFFSLSLSPAAAQTG